MMRGCKVSRMQTAYKGKFSHNTGITRQSKMSPESAKQFEAWPFGQLNLGPSISHRILHVHDQVIWGIRHSWAVLNVILILGPYPFSKLELYSCEIKAIFVGWTYGNFGVILGWFKFFWGGNKRSENCLGKIPTFPRLRSRVASFSLGPFHLQQCSLARLPWAPVK